MAKEAEEVKNIFKEIENDPILKRYKEWAVNSLAARTIKTDRRIESEKILEQIDDIRTPGKPLTLPETYRKGRLFFEKLKLPVPSDKFLSVIDFSA